MDQQYWAWLNTEWNAGRLTRPGIALQSFRNHPRTFLKTYPLQNNYDPQNDGIFRAHIFNGAAGQRPGSILKTQNMHTTESFTIQPRPASLGKGIRSGFTVCIPARAIRLRYGICSMAAGPTSC